MAPPPRISQRANLQRRLLYCPRPLFSSSTPPKSQSLAHPCQSVAAPPVLLAHRTLPHSILNLLCNPSSSSHLDNLSHRKDGSTKSLRPSRHTYTDPYHPISINPCILCLFSILHTTQVTCPSCTSLAPCDFDSPTTNTLSHLHLESPTTADKNDDQTNSSVSAGAMSDIEGPSPVTTATNVDTAETINARDATTPEKKLPPAHATDSMEADLPNDTSNPADGDSEAETLIESPEKRRVAAMLATDLTIKTESTESSGKPRDDGIDNGPELPSSDGKSRKRKRENESHDGVKRVPSAPSSALSSPSPEELQHDLSDEIPRKTKSPTQPTHRQRDERRDTSRDRDSRRKEKVDGQIKVKKRRPSDVFTDNQKGPSAKQRHTSDIHERRETRSATYPRHSSSDRSPSPRPSSRSHKRGLSIQSVNNSANKSKRAGPLLNGRARNRSEDRHSVSTEGSGSPGPQIPNLRKFTSNDHDVTSPIKQPAGPFSRRNRDQNGRTRLARACADNKLELAKLRFDERPEDLNVADNAGNTPLQIAALEGYVEIVEFLLSKSCEVDTRNIDRETPLIDAVENGHVDVVQLLLEHGANPRLGNAKGDEPYELVPQDDENYGAIRALLADAKAKHKESKRRYSDDQGTITSAPIRSSSQAASAASPRDSPPIYNEVPPTIYSRRRTGRSEQTRNDLLWQAQTPENLQRLAAKGDSEGVASILNVLEGKAVQPAAVVAAARGGHHQTLEMLIALGNPDPDPSPIRNGDFKPGYNTPMLAAIGRGNIEVVKLLLGQTDFNPRRRDSKGRTYHEISRERKGDRWEEEYKILKEAYDRAKSPDNRKQESPKKLKDREKESKRLERRSPSPRPGRRPQRSPTSTTKEANTRNLDSHRESKREKLSTEHRSTKSRDPEPPVKTHRTRRSQSDLPTITAEGEIQKRRRLIPGKVFNERRASAASHKTSSDDEDVDIRANLRREVNKRERDRSLLKRSRDSTTPERPPSRDSERDVQKKRRRVLSDSSPEDMKNEPILKKQSPDRSSPTRDRKSMQSDIVVDTSHMEDTQMLDLPIKSDGDENSEAKKEAAAEAKEHERKQAEEAERLAKEEAARKKKEEEEEKEAQAEAERKAQEEAERKKREAEEEARILAEKLAQEAARKKEEEEKAKAEAEKRAAEAAEEERRKAEEEAAAAARAAEEKRKAEEAAEAQRKLEEEEAAAAAARQREEEERLQKQRKEEEDRAERIRKEEERQRRIEERRRREAEEQERIRREALPALLCKTAKMIDSGDDTVREPSWLRKFLPLYTVYFHQLDPNCSKEVADEQWIPNFQAAGLLAAKDLHLRQYTQLEKRAVNDRERLHLWKVAGVKLSTDYHANAANTTWEHTLSSYTESGAKFSAMEPLFWVRLSDFKDLIPLHSHLQGLSIKTQQIGVHPIKLPTPSDSSIPQPIAQPIAQPISQPISQPNGISPSTSQGINGILPNGITITNGYHDH